MKSLHNTETPSKKTKLLTARKNHSDLLSGIGLGKIMKSYTARHANTAMSMLGSAGPNGSTNAYPGSSVVQRRLMMG